MFFSTYFIGLNDGIDRADNMDDDEDEMMKRGIRSTKFNKII